MHFSICDTKIYPIIAHKILLSGIGQYVSLTDSTHKTLKNNLWCNIMAQQNLKWL